MYYPLLDIYLEHYIAKQSNVMLFFTLEKYKMLAEW